MLMIVFTLALVAGSTQLSTMAGFLVSSEVGLRVSLGLALIALIMVAIAENARIPVDNPATHLELAIGGFLLAVFETSVAKMRVFRVPEFLGAALMLGLLATLLLFVSGSL